MKTQISVKNTHVSGQLLSINQNMKQHAGKTILYLTKFKFMQQDCKYLKQVKDFIYQVKYELNFKHQDKKQQIAHFNKIQQKISDNIKIAELCKIKMSRQIIQHRSKPQFQEENQIITKSYEEKLQQINNSLIQSQRNVQTAQNIKKTLAKDNSQPSSQNIFMQNYLNTYFQKYTHNLTVIESVQIKNRVRQRLMYYLRLKSEKALIFKNKIRKAQNSLKIINIHSCSLLQNQQSLKVEEQNRANYKKFKMRYHEINKSRKSKSLDEFILCKNMSDNIQSKTLNKKSDKNRIKQSMTINELVNSGLKICLSTIRQKNKIVQHKIQRLKIGIQLIQKQLLIKKLQKQIQQDEYILNQDEQEVDKQDNKKIMLVLLQAEKFNKTFKIRQCSLPFPQKLKQVNIAKNQYVSKEWPNLPQKRVSKCISKISYSSKVKSESYIKLVRFDSELDLILKKQAQKRQIKNKNSKKGIKLFIKSSQKSPQKEINRDMVLTVSSSSENNINQQSISANK